MCYFVHVQHTDPDGDWVSHYACPGFDDAVRAVDHALGQRGIDVDLTLRDADGQPCCTVLPQGHFDPLPF